MKFKKLGKAKIDLKAEEWFIEGLRDRFQMNRRMIDTRQDVKKFRNAYLKVIQANTPSIRKTDKRREYFEVRTEYRKELNELMTNVFKEILEESFTYPVVLQKVKDFDHAREWRHCLYKGYIYEWDKHGYSGDGMKETIEAAENPLPTTESSSS